MDFCPIKLSPCWVWSRVWNRKRGLIWYLDGLRKLGDVPWQAVILGTGDPKLEKSARKLAKISLDVSHFEAKYDAKLARLIYAGADIFLMPSRYEPCGLSQMIAMRYGCVPVVRAVGGLHDTVTDGETGFVFIKPRVKDFVAAIQRALATYDEKRSLASYADKRNEPGFLVDEFGSEIF